MANIHGYGALPKKEDKKGMEEFSVGGAQRYRIRLVELDNTFLIADATCRLHHLVIISKTAVMRPTNSDIIAQARG